MESWKTTSLVVLVVLGLVGHDALTEAAPVGLGDGRAIEIDYADARGIRYINGHLGLLSGLSIMKSSLLEDRTLIEFDVGTLSGTILQATLDLSIENWDPGGAVGIIDVYTYAANGVVTVDDFYAGEWFSSFPFNDHLASVLLDVTDAVQGAVEGEDPYLGFRLSTDTSDRYFLGAVVALPDPVLTVIPEPGVLALLTFGGTCVVLCWRGSAMRRG